MIEEVEENQGGVENAHPEESQGEIENICLEQDEGGIENIPLEEELQASAYYLTGPKLYLCALSIVF
jgi:hypothetical protein